MRLPGFTAEAALYQKRVNYRVPSTDIRLGEAVELAFWICRGNYCCDEWGDCIHKGHVLM
jgi:hypothetical protein